ncbi:MAG: transposase family protein [Candidatus Nitrosocosmicus sp.]
MLFKSFTGLSVEEFDDIYKKEIAKRYCKHEIQHLSKIKDTRERKDGDIGRQFKLDVKNRFLMLLVYYRLYITYTLAGFLFNLDQSNL